MISNRTLKHLIFLACIFLSSTLVLNACKPPTVTPQPQTLEDVNPDRSNKDATDPDAASGGRVNGLAVASDRSAYYLASEWGGLYKSTDDGDSWFRLNGHLPAVTWDVAVDPNDIDQVYATSFYDGRVESLAGINISSDAGTTWTHPASSTPPEGFCANEERRREPSAFGIAIDPDDSAKIYIGTNCGLAVSRDSGANWIYIDPTPGDGADNIWDVVVHHQGIIDLCGDDGHQRSTDGGNTWSSASGVGLPSGRCSIVASPEEQDVLIAVSGISIYESDDGGGTWPFTLTNPKSQGRIPFVEVNRGSGGDFDLWFGDIQLHRTACAQPSSGTGRRCPGNTWIGPFTRATGGHDDTGDILFDPSGEANACPILFSSDGGVYVNTRTTNPDCQDPLWEQPEITPHALWVFGMAGVHVLGDDNEDLYFGTQDNGTFASRNIGVANPTWDNRDCCDSFDISAEATQVLYTSCCFNVGRSNRLYLRNAGMTGGSEINTYPDPNANLPGFRNIDVIDIFGTNQYVVVMTSGVYFTNDVTANPIVWSQLGTSTSTPANVCNVRASVSDGDPSFYIQANNCDDARPLGLRELWRIDGASSTRSWTQINPPGGAGGFGVFAVDPVNPDRLLASHLQTNADPAVIISTDGGQNWSNLPDLDSLMTANGVFRYRTVRGPTNFTSVNGYPQPTMFAFDPNDSNIIVAGGADSGIFLSEDAGSTWKLVTDPIDPVASGKPHISRPLFAYFDHEPQGNSQDKVTIYIGTKGRGVWRLHLNMPSP